MSQKAKSKRQQRAQSRLALARQRQQERARRQEKAAQRLERRWQQTLGELASRGATLIEQEAIEGAIERPTYLVILGEKRYTFRTRKQLWRWLHPKRREEQEMSWAERHVQWMIENNCDDHGNPWPWDEEE